MGHNGCDGSQASGPWAIGSGYRFSTMAVTKSFFGWISDSNFHMMDLTPLAPNEKGIRLAGLHYGAPKDGARTHSSSQSTNRKSN